jgi:UDP-N-acetylmuramate--alanine ligase
MSPSVSSSLPRRGRVVIGGGGTSGHVLPAVAIAEMLVDRGLDPADIHFVGTLRGVDASILGETEHPFTLLPVTGLKRSVSPGALVHNMRMSRQQQRAVKAMEKFLREWQPAVVVSVGGYGSLAPMRAAERLGIDTVVVSYDSRPGLATKRQARKATLVTKPDESSPLERGVVAGAPVRRRLRELDLAAERDAARGRLGLPSTAFVVGVVGGSLGSGVLNERVPEVLVDPRLADVHWYHVCGERFANDVTSAARNDSRSSGRHHLVAYESDMAAFYAASDVVVCRAGASTIAEIATVGIPAIVVPWAGAAENHQETNARMLTEVGGAVFVAESEFTAQRLADEVLRLRADHEARRVMAEAARRVGEANRRGVVGSLIADLVDAHRTVPTRLSLDAVCRLHVVGIGGPGMSALARALAGMGHRVSGSDIRESEVIDQLRAEGIEISVGHRASLVEGCDAVCASTGVPADNVEMAEARRRGIPALTRAEMLAAACAQGRALGVAGTHGKTTTTSLLALMLGGASGRCGFVVGGDAPGLTTNGRWGISTSSDVPFVVEADESDGTHEALPLRGAIITNVDVDHLDHFGSFEGIVASFARFARAVAGPVVVCSDDPALAALAGELRAEGASVVTYGIGPEAEMAVTEVRQVGELLTYRIEPRGIAAGLVPGGSVDVELRAQGRHNALNATAAMTMALLNDVPLGEILDVMRTFAGVGRRFELRGRSEGVTFIDDYAHVPTEISTLLRSLREGEFADRRVVAVFQPNRYHRMAVMSPEYRDAFVDADVAVITDIYASGTPKIEGVTGRLVVDAIEAAHPDQRVEWFAGRSELIEGVVSLLQDGDVCVSFGCGDIESFPDEAMNEMALRRVGRELANRGIRVTEHAPLGERTTYKTGGRARFGVEIESMDQLDVLASVVADRPVPLVVVGRGSNMLVADAGFHGLAVSLGDVASYVAEIDDAPDVSPESVLVEIGGATPLPVTARQLSALGIAGFEWAVGVPGTIGGAVRMNAGGHGADMAAALREAEILSLRTGDRAWVPASELGLRFRGSDLSHHHVVCAVRLELVRSTPGCGDVAISEIVRWRRENQPGGQNAGSVFVNPDSGARSAGEIIDRLGLRGTRVGGAAVSSKHANFIQADEGATSADVIGVMAEVHRRVLAETGLSLHSEVRLVGFAPGLPFADDTLFSSGDDRLDAYLRAHRRGG